MPYVDAVIFESISYGFDQMESLPRNGRLKFPQKRPWQKFVNFGYETPVYCPLQNHSAWKVSENGKR
jgi:hypothetical protein